MSGALATKGDHGMSHVPDIQLNGPALSPEQAKLPCALTISQFAARFQVKPDTIRKWVKRGKVRPLDLDTKPMLFSETEVLRVLHCQRTVNIFA